MKTRIIGMMVAVGFAIGFGAACETGQPAASCPTPHTSVFAVYTVAPEDAAKTCGALTGEFWGVSKYNIPGTTTNTLAIRPEQMSNFYRDPRLVQGTDALDALGGFDNEANAEGFCSARDMAPASVNLAGEAGDVDAGVDPTPAAAVSYKLTQLEFVGTPRVPGTQFRGQMEYTEDGCTARYNIVGIAPWVPCEVLDADENGTGVGDDALCNTTDLPDGGTGAACNEFGECLNPDFAMKCDPVNFVCVPAGEIPSLKQ